MGYFIFVFFFSNKKYSKPESSDFSKVKLIFFVLQNIFLVSLWRNKSSFIFKKYPIFDLTSSIKIRCLLQRFSVAQKISYLLRFFFRFALNPCLSEEISFDILTSKRTFISYFSLSVCQCYDILRKKQNKSLKKCHSLKEYYANQIQKIDENAFGKSINMFKNRKIL